jgi:hypothetical protein
MGKSIAIVQSNYLPWIGYFDFVNSVDEFVLYDEVQYTRGDWRNRNKIATPSGVQWLTIPLRTKGNYSEPICNMEVSGDDWSEAHWKSLSRNYRRSSHFDEIASEFEPLYKNLDMHLLSEINFTITSQILKKIGIRTVLSDSRSYISDKGKTQRLLGICLAAGASKYVSGPTARSYLDQGLFEEHGVEVEYFSYPSYPTYGQVWGEFVPNLSIIDVLFNCGWDLGRFFERREE